MKRLTISGKKDHLLINNKPFFYLADTVWSAFSNTTLEEWEEYLHYRKTQNFNALQISVLPILHDASDTYVGECPFHVKDNGDWDFMKFNESFFDRAEKMVEMAVEQGFIPVLVLLWCNYVPGTWANARRPDKTMPIEAVESFTEYVVRRFAKYQPVYFVSGDTKFESKEIKEYFRITLSKVKEIDAKALSALHVVGSFHEVPQEFIELDNLDLFIYQSGHNIEDQHMTYQLAENFQVKSVKKPILNSEPCYEGHGYGNKYGRFGAFDLRKAFWSSILSGAKAGFTYGAHGIWSWHKRGAAFTSEAWSKLPFDWRSALRLQGAWDVSYSKWLYERYELYDIEASNELLDMSEEDIRLAISPDGNKIVLYTPYSIDVRVKLDLSQYNFEAIDLSTKNVMKPSVVTGGGTSVIKMIDANTDVVYFGLKK
jgi:hypothetical protein